MEAKKHFFVEHNPRGFSNAWEIMAFESRQARDDFLSSRSSERYTAITRDAAREQLAAGFLSPGTYDCTGGLNCYRASNSDRVDEDRRAECAQWIQGMALQYFDGDIPDGFSMVPVRI